MVRAEGGIVLRFFGTAPAIPAGLCFMPAALAAAGCAAPAEIAARGPVPPSEWRSPGAEEAGSPAPPLPADWWSGFGDPQLDRVVAEALAANPTLERAAARLEQAAADSEQALAAFLPGVGVSARRAQQRQNFIGLPIPGLGPDEALSNTFTTYGASLDISWELNLWREASPRARAAAAGLQSVIAETAGARISLAGQAVKAYFGAVGAAGNKRLARRLAVSHEESLGRVRRRVARGLLPFAEVRRAEAAHAQALADLSAAVQVGGAALRRLLAVLGRYPGGADLELPETLPPPPPPAPPGIPADLVARRPDVAAAERRAAASREFTRIARRARYPQFPLTGALGTSTARLDQLTDGDFSVWSFIAGLAAPVFQGGRIGAAIRRSEAEDAELLAAYLETILTAYAEVEGALDAETRLREQEGALAGAWESALAVSALAEERHRAGVLDALARDEARRAADQIERRLIEARRSRLDNRVNLFLALGGGFERPDAADRTGAAAR